MSSERNLSNNSCIVIIGVIGTITTIIVSAITIYTFMTGRSQLIDSPSVQNQLPPTATLMYVAPVEPSDDNIDKPMAEENIPTPASADFVLNSFVPSTSCPTVQGAIWMQYPNVWYGPFAGGDAISYNSWGGFNVWDADLLNIYGLYGSIIPYPDPYLQMPRNQWVPLQQSIFNVCVDTVGNVLSFANQ